MVGNAEASRLERDLAAARTAAMANGVGVKSRLQALQIAYVFLSHLSLIMFDATLCPATSIPTSNSVHVFAIFAVERT